jgi:hypothetical protein
MKAKFINEDFGDYDLKINKELILLKIIELSVRIQHKEKEFYNAKCIEFLSNILMEENESLIHTFIKWLDESTKKEFMILFM